MKKCLICKKEIPSKEEICSECETFFKWRYSKNYAENFERLKKYFSRKSDSIKSRRAK